MMFDYFNMQVALTFLDILLFVQSLLSADFFLILDECEVLIKTDNINSGPTVFPVTNLNRKNKVLIRIDQNL